MSAPAALCRASVIPALALLAACSSPPHSTPARPWHPAMTVTPVKCGSLGHGQRGLEYRFTNEGDSPAGPVVSAEFLFSKAPGPGVTGQGLTSSVATALPGRSGTGVVAAPPGTLFDGCQITGWRIAVVGVVVYG